MTSAVAHHASLAVALLALSAPALADAPSSSYGAGPAGGLLPPWTSSDDIPLPESARSVVPQKPDLPLFVAPGSTEPHRGSTLANTRLPLFGAKRGPGCGGRWLLVGPLAWICSDGAAVSPDEPLAPAAPRADDGLPYRYYFVGKEGASGFTDLNRVDDDAPDGDLDAGFAVAVVGERTVHGERWVRTRSGYWIAARELGDAHPSTFQGAKLTDASAQDVLDVAWVATDRASEYDQPRAGKPVASHLRFDRVHWREEGGPSSPPASSGLMVRVSEDGAPPRWMRAKDLTHPTVAAPPEEALGHAVDERWIDVQLASQTLVAYEGTRPVYATLVSAGRGAPGTDAATPLGVHRIWVKLLSTNMDNLDVEEADDHFSIEDVPYVQFFDKAVALHGAFWHRDFGRPHSHGCVNLAPLDAAWLFAFTSPHVPAGWSAALPVVFERGTVVRVR